MPEKFRVEAHHAYAKTKADELDLVPGDVVWVTSDEHSSWWVGYKEAAPQEQGWFPSNFVRRLEDQPPAAAAAEHKPRSKPRLRREVRITKKYEAVDEDDLSLNVGDVVEIKKEVDGWYLGRFNGNIGMFPVSYAEEYTSEQQQQQPQQPPPPQQPPRTSMSASRPLPVPPVPGASAAPPPIPSVAQATSPLSRRGTTSNAPAPAIAPGIGGYSGAPPALPSRNPPLPPRASTDVSRLSERTLASFAAADESFDEGKKEKGKSSHRISRLFGSKKHKHREGQPDAGAPPAAAAAEASLSPRMEQPQAIAAYDDEEPAGTSSISPALPSRPLPQPAGIMSSPPPVPSTGAAKLPPLPTAAMPPQPLAGIPLEPTAQRRPSVSSIGTASSISVAPIQPLPEIQKPASVVSAENESDRERGAIVTEDLELSPVAEDDGDVENSEDAAVEPKARTAGPKLAKIIEDFEAASPEELNLMQGDVVTIISQGTENEDRWKGEYHGKKGYFPAHVVELIEESAELEDNGEESSGEAASKPKGFKLAAYGVQQGGIGSIFAAGGMPMLRKSGPRKNSDADQQQQQQQQSSAAAMAAPVPAQPPVIPKLRSVQRSASKEEPKEEEEEPQQQTNFLAQLNRVPRKSVKSASSEESLQVSPQPMAAVPPVPISRKATASSSAEPETADSREASAGAAPPAGVPEMESRETDSIAEVPETDAAADAVVPPGSSKKNKKAAAEDVSNEQAEAIDAEDQAAGVEQDGEDAQASAEDSEQQANNISSNSSPALDPVKSPALSNVKRLVRRGPRQMPTSEGLKKKSSEESQAQSLRSALQNEKTAEPEPEPQPEPEVAKSARPALPEKPRGIGSRFSQFGGPQLPSGGFKASGRVGSAMASRLAALQARASGNNDDDDDGDNTGAAAAAPNGSAADTNAGNGSVGGGSSRSFAASRTSSVDAASSPPSGGRKPSASAATAAAAAAAVSSEWQRQVEEEQTRLRSDINKAREGSEAAARLESRLVASERENQAHKQTISRLEEHIQTLAAQLSALKSDVAGIQRSVAGLDSSKGVTAVEVASIVRGELGSALQPLEKQTLALSKENKALDKKVGELRAYVDELVVEDDQQQ